MSPRSRIALGLAVAPLSLSLSVGTSASAHAASAPPVTLVGHSATSAVPVAARAAEVSRLTSRGGALHKAGLAGTVASGQRYVVSAKVRTNRASAVGRLLVQETADRRTLGRVVTKFRATKSWRWVSVSGVSHRAGSLLSAHVIAKRLHVAARCWSPDWSFARLPCATRQSPRRPWGPSSRI